MNRRYAAILAILITLLIAVNAHLFSKSSQREVVLVERIIDGDTLELEDGTIIRLLNINTPEKNEPFSSLSKEFLQSFLNRTVEIEVTGTEKYGRTLARVYTPDYLNLALVEQGMATKFLVDESERKKFLEAEERAIKESQGMWSSSHYQECIHVQLDKKQEIVTLSSSCPLNLQGWKIKDESRKYYKFEAIPLTTIRIHSGHGNNNASDIFMGSATNVWNDDRDTLYIFDSEGHLAYHEAYGY
ncbi:thermonuclease family protein [Candidatus Pacearchaeota archaeon]|nr:thermonuclease family protein [Candidatus Pacearchaeota archaeon]